MIQAEIIEHGFTAMGGPCRLLIGAPGSGAGPGDDALLARVRAEIERLEQRYSRYRPDSLVSQINAAAGSGEPTAIDPETAGLCRYIDTLWQQSDGAFDPTSGILRRAWDFQFAVIPGQEELDTLLPLIGWDKVRWDDSSIELPLAGMQLDLGGVVKEYTVDSVVRLLTEAGVGSALFDMAGDLYTLGRPSGRKGWRVSIRHPREAGALCTLELTDVALASSGDYQRFFDFGGKRYSHLLDARSGWPVEGLLCASVLSPQCMVAGSAASIALLKPAGEGLEWLENLGLPWLAVDSNLRVHGPLGEVPG